MKIDWRSLERIEEAGETAGHLDLASGSFLSEEQGGSDQPPRDGQLLALYPLLEPDPAHLHKALLASIPDDRLRRSTFKAWRELTRVSARSRLFASREVWEAECEKKRETFEAALSESPAIAERWKHGARLLSRLELWNCLSREGIEIDNPPGWVGETTRLRDEYSRGWPAFLRSRLQVVEEWLLSAAPEIIGDLQPPASDSAISALELQLVESGAMPFGSDLRVLFGWHDGTMHGRGLAATTSFIFGFWLLSVEDALGACELMRAIQRTSQSGSLDSPRWDPRWLPILSNGIGDLWFLDLRPGHSPCVVEYLHEDPDTNAILFKDLASFIEAYADAAEDGLLIADSDFGVQPRSWPEWAAHCSLYGRGARKTQSS